VTNARPSSAMITPVPSRYLSSNRSADAVHGANGRMQLEHSGPQPVRPHMNFDEWRVTPPVSGVGSR
jgi:hypothetical protein